MQPTVDGAFYVHPCNLASVQIEAWRDSHQYPRNFHQHAVRVTLLRASLDKLLPGLGIGTLAISRQYGPALE